MIRHTTQDFSRCRSTRRRTTVAVSLLALAGLAWAALPPGDEVARADAKPASATATPAGLGAIEPFVTKYCVDCHGPKARKADLDLTVFKDEQSIVKNRKIWQAAVEQVHGGDMPPPKKPQPSDAETAKFMTAVAAIFEKADRTAKPDPGRVTVRRLNRAEYDNTIRDLLGVDWAPAADFPSDDIGHGFDNIGDVLSVSPVLMERYLAAAETIMAKAIALEPIKPNSRHTGAQFTEPAGRIPEVRYRPVFSGSIFTRFKLNDEGEYKLRTRALVGAPDAKWTAARPDDAKAAKGKDGEPIKAALIIDGKEVQAFDVTATDGRKAPTIEHTVTLPAGEHKFEVALKSGGTATKAMLVQFIEVVGPTDSRPAPHRKWLGNVDPKAPDKAVKTREILTKFASAAYRRPATKPEVDRLVQLAQSVEAQGQKWEAGIQFAFQAVLSSPKFIFRLELDDRPDSAEPQAIDEFALASRLSYFLWSSMPDAELTALAEKKQLTANLDAQVRRMLKDPKAEALVENFAMQWLQLRRLKTYAPDTKTYPAFDDRLRKSMLRETELFVEAVIKEDRSILDLIDADFTFLDRRLARHYGIADTNGNLVGQKPAKPVGTPLVQQGRGGFRDRGGESEFYRVSLQDRSRGGILTQASVLTVTSNPTRTSPVKRGKWVLEQILGTPPPPAPPNVPELEEAGEGHQLKGTLRQRMEQHRENPACASCHAKMDPMGFAFEQFDGVGGFRTTDGGSPIDPSGVLPDGKKFAGPAELKSMLKEKKELFARALAEKLLTYATGRGVEYYDKRAIDKIVAGMSKDGFKFSTLCVEVAKSDPFRMRRGLKQSE